MSKKRFSDSSEATAFFDNLEATLNDPRAVDWLTATDDNYDTNTYPLWVQIRAKFKTLQKELDSAA